jgi:predicted nucleic acid-binding protein
MAGQPRADEARQVILVDSSVWVDYFRGSATPQADRLDELLGAVPIAVGDLILTEVLQGFGPEREFNEARRLLTALEVVNLGGLDVAIEAARNYRKLRELGVTIRKTIDTVIATRCIIDGLQLLHSDRDFDAFEQHLGLQCVVCAS